MRVKGPCYHPGKELKSEFVLLAGGKQSERYDRIISGGPTPN